MNAKTRRQVGTKIVNLILICSLLLSSCAYLPQDVQHAWDSIWQQTVGVAINYIKELFQDQVDKAKQEVTSTVDDIISSIIDKPLEYMGWRVPDDVGIVSLAINPTTPRPEIEAAFKAAYKRAGGGRVIGWPDELVTYWSDSQHELLIQYFFDGSQGRSAILMQNGETEAFYSFGKFLETYTNLGGPGKAGLPMSDSEEMNNNSVVFFWINWGRGRIQTFSDSGTYAITLRKGSEIPHILPPDLWYQARISEIGYPLSSYPFEDQDWREIENLTAEVQDVLEEWEEQPMRVVVFENGALFFNPSQTRFETISTQALFGGPLSSSVFMLDLKEILLEEYDRRFGINFDDDCFASTLQHAGYMAGSDAFQSLVTEVSLLPIRSVLQGISLFTVNIYSKLVIASAEILVDTISGDELGEAVAKAVAEEVLDTVYSYGIGDILSQPAASVTVSGVEEEYNQIMKGRFQRAIQTKPGLVAPLVDFRTTLPVQLYVSYDPKSNLVSGVMHCGDCGNGSQANYGFYFLFTTRELSGTGDVSDVWDGRIHFIDLATGEEIP